MRRLAFTFIELVFSIVVVGLVILSIPLIVRQSNANTMESQNVIGYYNALTLMNVIRNKPWDLGNINGAMDNFTASGGYYILNTGNAALDCRVLDATKQNIISKPGLGISDRRRMCDPNANTASPITASNNLDNIGAFNNYTQTITSGGNTFFILDVGVRYVNINFGNNTTAGTIVNANSITDIKEIEVRLSRQINGTKELVSTYKYYAANIGTDVPFAKDN
ncbi:hypothetical protein [Helicobacter sp. MIT 99-5507]|uniref:hypothetical protein n=1 Tax=Helicobacter sp. MIT 99-5507 TaxID=152489 RepID=UPI000E1E49CF|nr:hypothetical protein [Helicobacter sp. MIT 99-5507]RDU56561.1 hypothetical protein CQA42_07010 [Helicobacter sp. MIT 99-5507]